MCSCKNVFFRVHNRSEVLLECEEIFLHERFRGSRPILVSCRLCLVTKLCFKISGIFLRQSLACLLIEAPFIKRLTCLIIPFHLLFYDCDSVSSLGIAEQCYCEETGNSILSERFHRPRRQSEFNYSTEIANHERHEFHRMNFMRIVHCRSSRNRSNIHFEYALRLWSPLAKEKEDLEVSRSQSSILRKNFFSKV